MRSFAQVCVFLCVLDSHLYREISKNLRKFAFFCIFIMVDIESINFEQENTPVDILFEQEDVIITGTSTGTRS